MTSGAREAQEYVFELTGGRLCLDFANTVSDRPSERPNEHLNSYNAFVSWGRQAGAIDGKEARRLLAEALRHPAEAEATLQRAIKLRETLYRTFFALARRRPPAVDDLEGLNSALPLALARLRLAASADGFAWEWAREETALDRVLWPVLRSAAELLASRDRLAVRACASESCLWLFMDTSKNKSRRWCDMRTCGNRSKARRHYQRKKAAATTPRDFDTN